MPHHDDAGHHIAFAVPIRNAAPKVGPEHHAADVLDANRNATWAGRQHDFSDIVDRLRISTAAHHVFGAAQFHQPSAHIVIPGAHGIGDLCDRDVIGLQAIRVDVHLILANEATQRRHLSHAWNRAQLIAEEPILQGPQLRQIALTGGVDQRVLEDPADAGCVRTKLGVDTLRKPRQHTGQIFERARARPVDIGAFVENDVDERIAEVRITAHRFDLGSAQHGRDDRVRHLVFHDVRAAVPARVDDHLRVAQVGDRIERHMQDGPHAGCNAEPDQQKDQEFVASRELDDRVNHARALWGAPGQALRLRRRPGGLVSTGSRNRSGSCRR